LKVRKRNGARQEFDRLKLRRSMQKAGASGINAAKVADVIEARCGDEAKTVDIKEQVITWLTPLDRTSAENYQAYKPGA
jgi:transcriptional regulator NrdR family protein